MFFLDVEPKPTTTEKKPPAFIDMFADEEIPEEVSMLVLIINYFTFRYWTKLQPLNRLMLAII
jgi:hypothetical protein